MTDVAGRVLTIHGIAPAVDQKRFCFRNMADAAAMDRYLSSVPLFVPLADALAGRGDALTIDDAIRGAADAALLARRHGHAVTLFVNPGQVESGAPYAFLVLNVLLDGLDGRPCELDGDTFSTVTGADRQALRRNIKARLSALINEQERLDFVARLADRWRVTTLDVPPHFRTLGRADLAALREAGVDLQNHGWSHTDHANLSGTDSAREVREGRAWLERELNVEAPYFAAPYGEALPKPEAAAVCDTWFAVSDALPAGPLSPHVFNREALDMPIAAPEAGRLRATVRRSLNLWAARFSGRLRS